MLIRRKGKEGLAGEDVGNELLRLVVDDSSHLFSVDDQRRISSCLFSAPLDPPSFLASSSSSAHR